MHCKQKTKQWPNSKKEIRTVVNFTQTKTNSRNKSQAKKAMDYKWDKTN